MEYKNRVDGIRIYGEQYRTIMDAEGVKNSSINWNAYNKIEKTSMDRNVESVISFEDAANLVSGQLPDMQSISLDEENSNVVENADLAFCYEEASGEYVAKWVFEMEDLTTYFVDCYSGEITR